MKLKRGQVIRIVQMDGCMAHVRNNVRVGEVTGFIVRTPYGLNGPFKYVQIRLVTGQQVEYPAEPRLWNQFTDGVWEYHD